MTAVENEKEEPQPILCTAHDIISLANLAYQNNLQYEVDNLNGYNVNTYYIQIDVGNTNITFGVYESKKLVTTYRMTSRTMRTSMTAAFTIITAAAAAYSMTPPF